jgi:hypothetical protein
MSCTDVQLIALMDFKPGATPPYQPKRREPPQKLRRKKGS